MLKQYLHKNEKLRSGLRLPEKDHIEEFIKWLQDKNLYSIIVIDELENIYEEIDNLE
jgi:hypothetical protein